MKLLPQIYSILSGTLSYLILHYIERERKWSFVQIILEILVGYYLGSCEKITHWVSSAVKFWFGGSIGGKSKSIKLWKSSPQGGGLKKSERRMLYQHLYQNKLKWSNLHMVEGLLDCFLVYWTLEIHRVFKETVHSIVQCHFNYSPMACYLIHASMCWLLIMQVKTVISSKLFLTWIPPRGREIVS